MEYRRWGVGGVCGVCLWYLWVGGVLWWFAQFLAGRLTTVRPATRRASAKVEGLAAETATRSMVRSRYGNWSSAVGGPKAVYCGKVVASSSPVFQSRMAGG